MAKRLTPEQAAFLEEIAERYPKMLEYYCARFFNYNPNWLPSVPDVVQEAYLRATKDIEKVMAAPSPAAWLKLCCQHIMLNMLRQKRHRKELLLPDAGQTLEMNTRHIMEAIEAWERDITLEDVVDAARNVLAGKEQPIFEDYFLNDMSTKETALLNGLTEDTVRGRISRIRKKLRKFFGVACQIMLVMFYISMMRYIL